MASIVETMPGADANLKNEFGRLEDLMWRSRRGTSLPPTPVLPAANDRIHTLGYNYCPVHTEIYGSYRNRDRRNCVLCIQIQNIRSNKLHFLPTRNLKYC